MGESNGEHSVLASAEMIDLKLQCMDRSLWLSLLSQASSALVAKCDFQGRVMWQSLNHRERAYRQ